MGSRTFVIGDIHADLVALDTLLSRFPPLTSSDTIVFLGDYVDRGSDAKGVVARVRALQETTYARVVLLRGNHEDMWIQCYKTPNMGFLLPHPNGCVNSFRSFTERAPLADDEYLEAHEIEQFINIPSWLPRDVIEWMSSLALWYEDEHAIYVHAGLESEGSEDNVWKHPRDCNAKPLMWMRDAAFFRGYEGKRLVFGHTKVSDLPDVERDEAVKLLGEPGDVWVRGTLLGIDTGSGKGGHLSAVELPAMKVYESR